MRKESLKIDSIVDDAEATNGEDAVDSDASDSGKLNGNDDAPSDVNPFDALLADKTTQNLVPPTAAARKSMQTDDIVSAVNAAIESLNDSDTAETAADEPVASTSAETNGTADADTDADADADADADDENADGYEVEEIVGHQYKGKRMKKLYQIRWKGYGADADTWEAETSLNCPELVSKYLEEHPDERPPEKMPKEKAPKRPKKEKPVVEAVPRVTPKRAAANVSLQEDSDDEEHYDVEAIVDHKMENSISMYLVKWKGWAAKHNTWEPELSLNCDDLLAKFKKGPKPKGKKTDKSVAIKSKAGSSKKTVSAKKAKNDDDAGYEVDKIVDSRSVKGKQQFLIRWKGWSADADTWEPLSSLNCPEKINEFEKSKKSPAKGKKVTGKVAVKKNTGKTATKAKAKAAVSDTESDAEPDYEVEDIVDEKTERGKRLFFVKWKGYSSKENTWEPESQLSCPDLVAKFEATRTPSTPTVSAGNKKRKSALKSPSVSPAKRGRKSVTYAEDVEAKKDTVKNGRRRRQTVDEERDPLATSDDDDNVKDNDASDDDAADDDDKEWDVEKIIDERKRRGVLEYLIRWKGCKPTSDTWEPSTQLNCSDAIAKFQKSKGIKPSSIKPSPKRRGRVAKK